MKNASTTRNNDAPQKTAEGTPAPNSTANPALGHALGLFTSFVWGITFVSTKVLLESFQPFEILLLRFAVGFLFLCCLSPRFLRMKARRDHLFFALAGLTGVLGYFLLENTALTYTTASNVSVITSTAPLFIALVAAALGRERPHWPTFIPGFILAICGIAFISFSGNEGPLSLGPGELLAVGGAALWGVYSNVLAHLRDRGYGTVECVKRIMVWGLLFMLALSPFMGVTWDFSRLTNWTNLGNVAFLGLVASGICYVTWTMAIRHLGASKAGAYIYLQPAFTIITAMIFLGETLTWRIALGLVLVLAGLLLSEGRFGQAKQEAKANVAETPAAATREERQ